MASARYTRYITPDNPEPPHVMTKKEKANNFWYYNKWFILGGILLAVIVAFFIHDLVSRVDPDYQIAVLSETTLPDDALTALENALSPLADDRNGDGKTVVAVVQYNVSATAASDSTSGADAAQSTPQSAVSAASADSSAASAASGALSAVQDPYAQMANDTKLIVDAQSGESMLFLTDNAAAYQTIYQMFAYNDGTDAPAAPPYDTAQLGKAWQDCPVLANLALGTWTDYAGASHDVQPLLENFVLVRRVKSTDAKQADYYSASMTLFEKLTAS